MKINQRKENEIYCSNCGVLINIESRYCSGCGFEQLDFDKLSIGINADINISNEQNHSTLVNKISKQPKSYTVSNVLIFLFISILVLSIFKMVHETNQKNISSSVNKESNNSALDINNCVGVGDQSCIDRVRQNFNNTGKTILGEEYLGDGRFGISFMDRQYAGAYNATVSTDCNCNVTNSNVTTVR